MKIAFVAYDRPDYHAGPIVNARRLLPEFKRLGHEPVGLFRYQDGGAPTADYLRHQGIEIRLRHGKGTTEDHIRWYLEQLADLQPDVFVPNISVAGWFAGRWAREAGIPSIAAMRGDDPFHWDLVREFVTGDRRWALSGIVTVNENLQQAICAARPQATRVVTIPSGVPLPESRIANLEPLRLCYLGRLFEENKNVSRVVEVMCRVLESRADATALVLGTGPALPLLQAAVAERKLSDRFEFAGAIQAERIPSLLRGGSMVLLASDHEGTPGALMDAMACGLVPVSADILGGVRELVVPRQTGILVENRVEAFVSAIEELSNDPAQWESYSNAARDHIEQHYSLTAAADRWIAFFEQLVAEAGPRRRCRLPRRLSLPPVREGLAVEDRRQVRWWQRWAERGRAKAAGLRRRLFRDRVITAHESS